MNNKCNHEFEKVARVYANHTPVGVAIYDQCKHCDTPVCNVVYANLEKIIGNLSKHAEFSSKEDEERCAVVIADGEVVGAKTVPDTDDDSSDEEKD